MINSSEYYNRQEVLVEIWEKAKRAFSSHIINEHKDIWRNLMNYECPECRSLSTGVSISQRDAFQTLQSPAFNQYKEAERENSL